MEEQKSCRDDGVHKKLLVGYSPTIAYLCILILVISLLITYEYQNGFPEYAHAFWKVLNYNLISTILGGTIFAFILKLFYEKGKVERHNLKHLQLAYEKTNKLILILTVFIDKIRCQHIDIALKQSIKEQNILEKCRRNRLVQDSTIMSLYEINSFDEKLVVEMIPDINPLRRSIAHTSLISENVKTNNNRIADREIQVKQVCSDPSLCFTDQIRLIGEINQRTMDMLLNFEETLDRTKIVLQDLSIKSCAFHKYLDLKKVQIEDPIILDQDYYEHNIDKELTRYLDSFRRREERDLEFEYVDVHASKS